MGGWVGGYGRTVPVLLPGCAPACLLLLDFVAVDGVVVAQSEELALEFLVALLGWVGGWVG